MKKKKIEARIIADSKNEHGNRITTFVLTYPRFIHAELLTHRLFSRNAASSRAIPTSRMIKDVEEDPFVPVAWQKAHSGMQGTEYIPSGGAIQAWKEAAQDAVERARYMSEVVGMTKQLVNRILEPFQWYTCIVTATEYDNFFELRCPQYEVGSKIYRSKKDAESYLKDYDGARFADDLLGWLKINKGQGEIHISLLAEAMLDARNESEPKKLRAVEWHIPFNNNLGKGYGNKRIVEAVQSIRCDKTAVDDFAYNEAKIKIATARCARVSYLNFEGKDDYEADIKLYDRLLSMGHMSPFEHCARAMTDLEYASHIQGVVSSQKDEYGVLNHEYYPIISKKAEESDFFDAKEGFNTNNNDRHGWSGNFRGFVQLRKDIE